MISCFDTSLLIFVFDAKANAPLDVATGKPVSHCQDRVRHLLEQHAKVKGSRIIIPTPAMAEFLVRTDPNLAGDYIGQLQRLKGCRIAPFAERAAVEFAELQRGILSDSSRRIARGAETRAKAKFDQQIVAIARAEGATTMYTDDKGLTGLSQRLGLTCIGISQLDLPPESQQGSLPLEPL